MIPTALLMEGVKPLIKKMVDDVIAPKLEQFAETVKMKKDEYLIPRREHFEEYLFRSYKNYNIVNTLVLRNEQKLLLDLYVPLSLVKRKYQWEAGEKTIIDKYPIDLVKKYNKKKSTKKANPPTNIYLKNCMMILSVSSLKRVFILISIVNH